MRLNDLMRVSLRQVMRHRRRYMGVVLAIALGVAGFLNIVTMSREVKNNFNENLDLIDEHPQPPDRWRGRAPR